MDREGRRDWELGDYLEHLDKLMDIKSSMQDDQWQRLRVVIVAEMKARFPEEDVRDLYF
jgi:hypothetical protein